MKKLFIYLAANWFNMIGGMFLGLCLPFGMNLTGSPLLDLVIFLPVGILLMATSYYYAFIYKE